MLLKDAILTSSKTIYTIIWYHKRMKKDAVAYLNTRKKGDFAAQKNEVENYSKYRFQIVEIFHDHRANATPPEKRKAFTAMLEYCAANNCSAIIIYDLAGLARDMDVGLATLKNLNERYTVYFVNDDFFGSRDDPELRREAIGNFITYMDRYQESARKAAAPASKKVKKGGGRPIGRPRALNDGQVEALITIRRTGTSISQICRMFGVSRSTVSKILNDYPELKGTWKGGRQEAAEEPTE
ncbi:hypothetical protein MBBA_2399 [Methanoculleus bourgensis]|nr:hypothetical protein MBBA_2399 [Methanoculleus bourgensis]